MEQLKKRTRGRPPLPPDRRTVRVNMRLHLPAKAQWYAWLWRVGYKDSTQFFQECVDNFIADNVVENHAEFKRKEKEE